MARIVVFEGADSIGKTTLARAVAEDNRWRYMKMSSPTASKPAEQRIEQKRCIELALDGLKHDDGFVFDRSWLGEWVYAPLFRGYTPDVHLFESIQEKLLKHDVFYVLIRAPSSWAQKHCDASDGKIGVYSNRYMLSTERFNTVQDKFIEALGRVSVGKKFVFNQANFPDKETAVNWMLLIVNKWRNRFPMYSKCDPMYALTCWNHKERFVNGTMETHSTCTCGHFKDHQLYPFWKRHHSITWGAGNVKDPLFIMIGEAPGMNGCGTTGIGFYFDKSGFLLRQLLYEHGIAETEYYITNISKCTPKNNILNHDFAEEDAKQHLTLELNTLPQDRVIIAVGRTAQKWLQEHYPDRDIRFIYHPAYAIRNGNTGEEAWRNDFEALLRSLGIES